MNITQENLTVAPSINEVPLSFKQKFPEVGISKNTISFEREEDMIVMCLSAFVHDYVHDYNLGSMHARVVKGNIHRSDPDTPSLFESLGINVGNTIFKIIAYPVGGHRDISMYNDTQFEDDTKVTPEKEAFYQYLNTNEYPISMTGGEDIKLPISSNILQEDYLEKQPDEIDKIKESLVEEPTIEEPAIEKPIIEKPIIEEPVIAEGVPTDIFVKTITFNDVKDNLFIPLAISNLNIEQIINAFEKNADFLDFHSALNTYVVTYLGYDTNTNEELENISRDKNEVANKAIKASLNYIINDLKNSTNSMYINFYGDMFSLLLHSYEIIMKKNGSQQNPFDILNSSEILYQFIIFYITYISVENYDKFNELLNNMTGGDGTPQEEELEMQELEMQEVDDKEKSEGEGSLSSMSSNLLPVQQKDVVEIPEYVFITHNNLLTTIARGMFIKLGIWKRIFFPDTPIDQISPTDYKFGPEELNQISYDTLVKIFPINPEEINGNRNNELLILEILILKRLLVEMSPMKTLSFGSKIDDDLKNYMDAFYLYNYGIKEEQQPDMLTMDEEIINNPNLTLNPELEQEGEKLFEMCDEDCDDNDFSYGSDMMMEGGMNYSDRKEMIDARKFEADERRKNKETASLLRDSEGVSSEEKMESKNPDTDIIEPPNPPAMPILFNKLKKMYQNNVLSIIQLQNSAIEPIEKDGVKITNLYDLLKLNQVLMHKTGSTLNIPAPKYKFVINNAANVGSNINGSRMFIPSSFYKTIENSIAEIKERVFDGDVVNQEKLSEYIEELTTKMKEQHDKIETNYKNEIKELNKKKRSKEITIREYNKLLELKYQQKVFERTEIIPLKNKLFLAKTLKENPDFFNDFEKNAYTWFKDSQPIFGLYRSIQRGIFCPTSSMMDAMDNCSLKYNTTEPKEVGTSYSEIVYNGPDGKKISFGGVVLNYNENINGNEELTAKLYYTLECNIGVNSSNDIMTLNTMPIKVSESNDLKARVAYKGVINMIKQIFDLSNSTEQLEGVDYIKEMWKRVQYQYDITGFNMLLSATSLKTMGDYLQECQACFKWGGYINNTEQFPNVLQNNEVFQRIKDKLIYRSVSEGGKIIPYDEQTGNGLRLGIQGDRPSGFRSIYMLLNGDDKGVNDQAITGYMFTSSTQNPSRTLLVARNMGKINSNGLKGSVIFVTRELQTPDRDSLLRELEFLNIKDKKKIVQGEYVNPEVTDSTIVGSIPTDDKLTIIPIPKNALLKNNAYEDWLDYNNKFVPVVKNDSSADSGTQDDGGTDAEQAKKERMNKLIQKKPKEIKITNEQKNQAKKIINNLRDDLTPEQKAQTKKVPFIPVSILDNLKEKTLEQGISDDVFNAIYADSLAIEEYERQEAEIQKVKAEKSAATRAEKALRDEKIQELQGRINNLQILLNPSIDVLNTQIQEKQTELEGLTGRGTKYSQLNALESSLKIQQDKKPKTEQTIQAKNKKIAEIQTSINMLRETYKSELDRINQIKIDIENLNNKKEEETKEINMLQNEINELKEKNNKKGGGTLSNKKKHNHKITRRKHCKKNKLTKRCKKIKIPKNTRKNVK